MRNKTSKNESHGLTYTCGMCKKNCRLVYLIRELRLWVCQKCFYDTGRN